MKKVGGLLWEELREQAAGHSPTRAFSRHRQPSRPTTSHGAVSPKALPPRRLPPPEMTDPGPEGDTDTKKLVTKLVVQKQPFSH